MLRIGALDVPDGRLLVMAIVNRTPDSFYDRGATYELAAAVRHVEGTDPEQPVPPSPTPLWWSSPT